MARYLGMDLGPMVRKRFADGEIYIQIQESIRGCDVYLMQPTCFPVIGLVKILTLGLRY
nr:ribose-phosphate pyrophosphokinase-like domain-containing protein [Leptolyngbya sp. 7M]